MIGIFSCILPAVGRIGTLTLGHIKTPAYVSSEGDIYAGVFLFVSGENQKFYAGHRSNTKEDI